MKKSSKQAGYICFPSWKEDGRDRPYSRSYDLIAHMVNVHQKYPGGAKNSAAYRTDNSDVRDATAEEITGYRDANKHCRKKWEEASSLGEPSRSSTRVEPEAPAKSRCASVREERGGGDASFGDRSGSCQRKKKDHAGLRKRKNCKTEHSARATADEEEPDDEEADRRKMAETQSRIEARQVAKDLAASAQNDVLQVQTLLLLHTQIIIYLKYYRDDCA